MQIFKNILKISNLPKHLSKFCFNKVPHKKYPITEIQYCYHNSKNYIGAIQENENFNYQQYTKKLKNFPWVQYQISRIQTVMKQTKQIKNQNYPQLRSSINQILNLLKYVTDARVYHQPFAVNIQDILEHLHRLIELFFSEKSNKTHENIQEEKMRTYQFIQFSIYFEICTDWNLGFDKRILNFYLHSYMNLLFDRNILKYINAYEILRESESSQIVIQILQKSSIGICSIIPKLRDKIQQSSLNPYQMSVYLKFIRNILNKSQISEQTNKIIQILGRYILKSQQQWSQSIIHCQNVTYSLFLITKHLQKKDQLSLDIYQWICQKIKKMDEKEDTLLEYLTTFNSHQDKITCLKIDICLFFIDYERLLPSQMRHFLINPFFQSKLVDIKNIKTNYWRYKYVVWVLDSILSNCSSYLEITHLICTSITLVTLKSNEEISWLTSFLKGITQKHSQQLHQIINIHYSISNWLTSISKECLLKQNPSDLCEILAVADIHPTLQSIYTPFLTNLLQLSLGHFLWSELTKLYFYGLKFNVQSFSEQSLWNMEYVRRYILNEYATMGLKRRQIPEDSYFYKIIGITTPQKFYRNHHKHEI